MEDLRTKLGRSWAGSLILPRTQSAVGLDLALVYQSA